jgi:mutator protein MutT
MKIVQILFQMEGNVALGFRQNVHAENNRWGFPGGRVEKGETLEEAAIREALEEVGVVPLALSYLFELTDEKGYEHSFFSCSEWNGNLVNKEPELCREVAWFKLSDLPVNCTDITYETRDKFIALDLDT